MKLLKGLSKSEKEFVKYVIADCKKHNVELFFGKGKSVRYDDGTTCAGWFLGESLDGDAKLACATGKSKKLWIPVLAHEHSHMEQWLEQVPAWTNCMETENGEDACGLVFEWLQGKIELKQEELWRCISLTREVEFDCEKRTAKKIKKFNLPIDVDEYIQKSNAYVAFYNVMTRTRKWYKPGRSPYTVDKVWKKMPKTFSRKRFYSLPMQDETYKLFQPCYDFDLSEAG